jgi:HSP20 family protein
VKEQNTVLDFAYRSGLNNIAFTELFLEHSATREVDMALVPKDLPDLLHSFQQQMDEIFERLFPLERKGTFGEREYSPPVDCFETVDHYVVEMELPGFCRKDLRLSIFHNIMIVEGFKREEEKKKTVNYICLEREFGRFSRNVEIPPMVDLNGVKARYEKGVLVVSFPKITESSAIMKDIPIE